MVSGGVARSVREGRRVWRRGFAALLLTAMAVRVEGQDAAKDLMRRMGASALLVDVATGRTVRELGRQGVGGVAPGSTLKPFVLLAGLEAGLVRAGTTVECRGTLIIPDHGKARNLACTHPRAMTMFAGREALAYSCNTYFARLAERMPAGVLIGGLKEFGVKVLGSTVSLEERELVALGLSGVRVTPEELARAYRRLALRMNDVALGGDGPVQIVKGGLLDSVRFGMANNAAVPGIVLAGKTGTASEAGQAWTHGWFAGIVFEADGEAAREVLVVYVPRGSGADAAGLAGKILGEWKR